MGKTVVKSVDDLVIDGKSTEFNCLPIGQRIMDSRTIFEKGTVAFQSALSPLSNLFPCPINFNRYRYSSAEQAYQHQRCLHHIYARNILAQQNPYEILSDGKDITDDEEWLVKRIPLMERLIRHKFEQVPVFADLLRKTG